jgi:D-alanyl-D-alanine dipeptidase
MTNPKTSAITLLAILMASCNQYHKSLPNNEYGLPIVRTKSNYSLTLKEDKDKRMVPLSAYVNPLITDWKYATDSNFTKQTLYQNPDAYMRLEAALALQKINEELKHKGLGLKIFDAYRPFSVTKKMWEVVPDENYAANPAKGSGHNRGAAVDLTLYDLSTGKELAMPTPFDDFTVKAHHDYMQLDSTVLANRQTLKDVMVKHGFLPLPTEWWHYYLPKAAERFELMDINFKKMKKLAKQ